jgi:hypothetical protein
MIFETNNFENNLFLILTLILLATKLFLALFLGKEVIGNRKRRGFLEPDFLFGIFILMVCLFVSRIIYAYFDFFLTQNDPALYYLPQNVTYWKIAGFIAAIGLFFFLLIVEKTILKFKSRGVLSILLLSGFIIVLFYPINSRESFEFASLIIIISVCICIIIPVSFLYIGLKAPEIRKISLLFALGTILYMIGVFIINGTVVNFLGINRITSYFLFLIFKLSGLITITFCATNLYIYNYFKPED